MQHLRFLLILIFSLPFFFTGYCADFTGSWDRGDTIVYGGKPFEIWSSIYQDGETISETKLPVVCYLSVDNVFQPDKDVLLKKDIITLPAWQNGGSGFHPMYDVTIPANNLPYGNLYYIMIIDPDHKIDESARYNNISATPVFYKGPGLDLAALSFNNNLKDTIYSETPEMTFAGMLANVGNVPLDGFTYQIGISEDSALTNVVHFKNIQSGAFGIKNVLRIIRDTLSLVNANLIEGKYYFFIKVDPDNVLKEVFEINNTIAVPFFYKKLVARDYAQLLFPKNGTKMIKTCNAILYDDGGPLKNYSRGVNSELIVFPSSDDKAIQIKVTAFKTQVNDKLILKSYPFTGLSKTYTAAPVIKDTSIFISDSPSGATGLAFNSSLWEDNTGFKLEISCVSKVVTDLEVINATVSDISVYPNPSEDFIYLQGNNIKEIRILGTSGEVMNVPLVGNSLDIRKLSAGMYTIQVSLLNSASTKNIKFLKARSE